MKKRILTILMIFLMTVILMPAVSGGEEVYASTNGISQSQAITWIRAQEGSTYAGNYGYQCVDLVREYYAYLGQARPLGDANTYLNDNNYHRPDGWTINYGTSGIQPGDITVWTGGDNGHVAIVVEVGANSCTIMQQNGDGNGINRTEASKGHYGTQYFSGITGYIHPDFRPTVNVDAGWYKLKTAVGDRFLDISGDGTSNGINVNIWESVTTGGQTFYIDWNQNHNGQCLRHKTSGKYVHTETNTSGGHNSILWEGNGQDGQQWIFEDAGDGYVYVRNLFGYYLDVGDGKNANGVNVGVWNFNGSNAQKWKLIKVSGSDLVSVDAGWYKIKTAVGDRFLDISGDGTSNGTNVNIWESVTTGGQTFYVDWNKDKSGYYVKHKTSGKVVHTETNSTGTHNSILWDDNLQHGQQWVFEDAGDGYVYIRNLFGYYLDVENSKNANGTNVRTWEYNDSKAQKWKFIHAHTLVKIEARAATINAEGNIEYWTCSSCGKYFKDSAGKTEITKADTVIPKTTCTNHSWDAGTITKAATCTDAGLKAFKCIKCGETKTESIPATGHKWGSWTTTKEPTTTETGMKERKCSVCGNTEQEVIPKKKDSGTSGNDDSGKTDMPSDSDKPAVKPTVSKVKVDLPALTISSAKAAKKSATVKWKKVGKKNQKKIAKIQIQYSMDKTFKSGVKTVTAKKSAASKKIKKLTSKKTYYFRVRAYKKASGVVHVSKWSKVRKAKIK